MTDKPRRAETEAYWADGVTGTGLRKVDQLCASDTRTTAQIISAYIESQNRDDATNSLLTVHYRGGREEFLFGMKLLASADPRERAVGADVLAQLGWGDRTFLDESVDALLGALKDPMDSVLESVIFALGHRASPRVSTPGVNRAHPGGRKLHTSHPRFPTLDFGCRGGLTASAGFSTSDCSARYRSVC